MPTILVVIDGQNDFVPGGALGVPGGDDALARIGEALIAKPDAIDELVLTQDWHPKDHLVSAAAGRIVAADGSLLEGYTPITRAAVNAGEVRGASKADQMLMVYNGVELEKCGGKEIMLWPEHCVADTPGAEIYPALARGVMAWSTPERQPYFYKKGLYAHQEQYGAFGDEIPRFGDGEMNFAEAEVARILNHDRKLWGGLARGHCLAASFDQAMSREDPVNYGTHTILTDGTADVPGFETFGDEWAAEWKAKGVQFMTVTEAFGLEAVAA